MLKNETRIRWLPDSISLFDANMKPLMPDSEDAVEEAYAKAEYLLVEKTDAYQSDLCFMEEHYGCPISALKPGSYEYDFDLASWKQIG